MGIAVESWTNAAVLVQSLLHKCNLIVYYLSLSFWYVVASVSTVRSSILLHAYSLGGHPYPSNKIPSLYLQWHSSLEMWFDCRVLSSIEYWLSQPTTSWGLSIVSYNSHRSSQLYCCESWGLKRLKNMSGRTKGILHTCVFWNGLDEAYSESPISNTMPKSPSKHRSICLQVGFQQLLLCF